MQRPLAPLRPFHYIDGALSSKESHHVRMQVVMFRAIGILILLWGLSQFFSGAFVAMNNTMVAVFGAVEMSAQVTTAQLEKKL